MERAFLPSEIYFSQDSISNKFGNKGTYEGQNIGTVLDAVVDVDTFIKGMAVCLIDLKTKDGPLKRWTTANNRSLWVAKELELIGKFPDQKVFRTNGVIPDWRNTTKNGGECVVVNFYGDKKDAIAGIKFKRAPFWQFYHDMTQTNKFEFLKNFKSVRIDSGYFSPDLTSGSGIKDDEEFMEKREWFLNEVANTSLTLD